MKRLLVLSSVILLLAAPAFGSVVEHTYVFNSPRVAAAGEYDLLSFHGTFPAGKLGGPTLPFRDISLLLPPGEAVARVEIVKENPVVLDRSLRLFPQQPVRPIVSPGGETLFVDPIAYESEEILLEDHAPGFRTHYASGLAIAVGTFTPVDYVPKTGSVTYYQSVTVRAYTEPSARSQDALALLPGSEPPLAGAGARLDNPEALSLYTPRATKQSDPYEYLIITKATYVDDFQPLADFYTRRGIRTEIQTVEFIDSNYSGTDTAEKIRACILDEYQNHGIQWVLLGGDADGEESDPSGKIVPYRGLYCVVYSSSTYEDDQIPSDCYFAGLDGSWNTDEDSRWGEPGEEDFYGEVHVGRAPMDSESEIATFITKTTRYQDAPVTGEVRDVLLLGEYLWDDPVTWGADYMEELIGVCTNNGYTTQGIPASYPIQELYDKTTGWDYPDLISAVNGGIHLVNHLGHANTWYDMKMWDTDVTDANFLNDGINHSYCIAYTQGCIAGGFDNFYPDSWYSDDCIAEKMLAIDHFAVAVLANSRYGWFTEGTTNGPSHHYHREFIDALFGEGITTLGAANTRSKAETVPFIDLPDEYEPGAHRWCFYTCNLLGDPAMDVWTDTPGTMTVNAPAEIDRNAASALVETGVAGSLVAFSWDCILYGRACSDSTGDADVVFDQPIASLDSLELVVTAHNYLAYENTIPVTDVTAVSETASAPARWALLPGSPNPFSRETAIEYSIRSRTAVSIRVYDVTGRTVARLVDETKPAGRHRVTWTPAKNLAPGIYFCEMSTGDFRAVRKLLVVR